MKQDELKIKGMQVGASPKVFENAALLRKRMTKPEKMLWEYLICSRNLSLKNLNNFMVRSQSN